MIARQLQNQDRSPVNMNGAGLGAQKNAHDFGIPRLMSRRTGLYLPEDVPIGTWLRLGRQLHLITDSSGWWLGDWLIYGEKNFPHRYRRAVEETGLDYQTLRNYAWIARRFPYRRRHERLSLAHHAEVAALSDEEQDWLLAEAERARWSRNRLRKEVRARRTIAGDPAQQQEEEAHASTDPAGVPGASGPGKPRLRSLRIQISADQEHRWRNAAGRIERSIEEWASLVLDEAASLEQGAGVLTG